MTIKSNILQHWAMIYGTIATAINSFGNDHACITTAVQSFSLPHILRWTLTVCLA